MECGSLLPLCSSARRADCVRSAGWESGSKLPQSRVMTDALRRRLFIACCVALAASATSLAVRGDIMDALGLQFHLDKAQVGWVAGAAFGGFTLAVLLAGPLIDHWGMGRLLATAFGCHVLGVAGTILAPSFWPLFAGTFVVGLGNGLVGAVVNPLVTTIYAGRKTARLNTMHAWFPAGVVAGGLAAFALGQLGLGWQVKMGIILVPTLAYGLLFLGKEFPKTERAQSGVSTAGMFREALRPAFLLWFGCMWLTAPTELGPNQWVTSIMRSMLPAALGAAGILVLVWMNAVMCAGRLLGPRVVGRLGPMRLLITAALVAAAGLLWLSAAHSLAAAFAAATVYSAAVCFFWPTMLGVTSERFPAGGSFLLALMSAAGNFSSQLIQPIMGGIQDHYTAAALAAHPDLPAKAASALGGEMALRWVVALPLVLVVVFTLIHRHHGKEGGYRVVKLGEGGPL